MECKKTIRFYFSPNGTTKETVRVISMPWRQIASDRDLLQRPMKEDMEIPEDTLVIVGMPVYSGRIPPLCAKMLSHLKSSGAPAVAAVVYGNREYDDALLELTTLLEKNGFLVIGAGAFVAQHSIFPSVGRGRPDLADKKEMASFADSCGRLLQELTPEIPGEIHVKGNAQLREPAVVPLKPSGRKHCTNCGACAKICPTHSIEPEKPWQTVRKTCISCGACIHVCPAGARKFRGPLYHLAGRIFLKKFAACRKPEVFYRSRRQETERPFPEKPHRGD